MLQWEELMTACAKTVADMLRGKSPEEMREILGVVNDFSPSEEEQVRRENEWMEEN